MKTDLPLSGVRVVEFTWVIAGPMITRSLAMLGAEVIRVESAKRAEFRFRDTGFGLLNNSKKSVSVDLSNEKGKAVARELIDHADIVVENFGHGVMAKNGLGYQSIIETNPDVIMLSCSGMGRTGPGRTMLAYGTLLQLNSGWSSLQGYAGEDDTVIGGAWTDPLTAATGTMIILAALLNRRQTGEGQYIDLSMVEATMCGVPQALMEYELNGRVATPTANQDVIKSPHACYPCAGEDRWVAISVGTDAEWSALVHAMGNPAWANEQRFGDSASRKQNEAELDDRISAWTQDQSAFDVADMLRAAGVPATVSLNIRDLIQDQDLQTRGYFHKYEAESSNEADWQIALGVPWVSEPAIEYPVTPAPALGQNNGYVLTEILGYSLQQIAELESAGALY